MDLHCSSHKTALKSFPGQCAVLLLMMLAIMGSAIAEDFYKDDIHRLDKQFQQLSEALYSTYAKGRHPGRPVDNLQQLEERVTDLLNESDIPGGISLLISHKQMMMDNPDDRRIFSLVGILLEYNAWQTANEIYTFIKDGSDKFLISNISFIFARHYIARHQWQRAIDALAGSYEDLAEEDSHYARLITGIAHQKLRQHRQALVYYQKIPVNSRYYIFAQLNIAIAFIRQGWWTDAQSAIKTSIESPQVIKTDEMVNRLYLVLGYSMLQKEYYRNARNAFRNISLDSRYTNRALLGLALAAANQEDFIGALNALSILKDRDARDLSVDECYLLFPFVYKKLKQQMTASATYSEAMNYYQNRIMEIDSILANLGDSGAIDIDQISDDNKTITIEKNTLDFASHYPPAFLSNLKRLHNISRILRSHPGGVPDRLEKKFYSLLNSYLAMYRKITHQLFKERQEYLRSYLNQSRYGLASLYDNSIPDQN